VKKLIENFIKQFYVGKQMVSTFDNRKSISSQL